jgi:hypothetical protein
MSRLEREARQEVEERVRDGDKGCGPRLTSCMWSAATRTSRVLP